MSDLGPLSFYLGIEVHQDDSGISFRQTTYAKRIIELGGLTECNLWQNRLNYPASSA